LDDIYLQLEIRNESSLYILQELVLLKTLRSDVNGESLTVL